MGRWAYGTIGLCADYFDAGDSEVMGRAWGRPDPTDRTDQAGRAAPSISQSHKPTSL